MNAAFVFSSLLFSSSFVRSFVRSFCVGPHKVRFCTWVPLGQWEAGRAPLPFPGAGIQGRGGETGRRKEGEKEEGKKESAFCALLVLSVITRDGRREKKKREKEKRKEKREEKILFLCYRNSNTSIRERGERERERAPEREK